MVLEFLLSAVRFLVIGIISLLPRIPTIRLDFLDGVFQLLSLADFFVDVRVLASCLSILLVVWNIRFFWGVIMWVIRKIPGVN